MARSRAEPSRRGSARPGRRSAREWALRGALACGALVFGYASIAGALANVIVKADPASAYTLASDNGLIAAAFAQQSFSAAPDSAADSEQAQIAVQALRGDPTAVEALNVLALQAQLRSEDETADRLFGYSVALSRRELQPQIWAIEKAVERGDIDQALENYDFALRTSRRAQQTLFPVLASAIAEPQIRASLLDILATEPVWTQAFIRYASVQGREPLAVAQLFRAGEAAGLPIEDADRARVVNGLVARNLMDDAWTYYRDFRSGVGRTSSRDPGFDFDGETSSSFDWTVGRTPGLSAAILQGKGGGFLDFAVPSSTRAVIVSQTQLLPPGEYRLEGRSSGVDQPVRSQPYWALTCRAGRELGRVDLPNSSEADGSFSGQFTVPADCPVQTLSLVVRASDKVSGVSGQIEHVQLSPATRQ